MYFHMFLSPDLTCKIQFKDVDNGDRIRLTVDKGGARLVKD